MNDDVGTTLDRLRAQRAALADFGLHAFRSDDLDELLHGAAERVSEALDVDLVKVLEHHPERNEMLMRAGVHWDPGVIGHTVLRDDIGSPGGYALEAGEPVLSPDIDAERRFEIPEVLRRHGVLSMVNVIIAGADRPYGVLEVDAREKRAFSGDDVAFLRNYANLLAAAIDRIRAHGELEQRAREQGVLARELGHRVRNVLSLVQALAAQTATEGRDAETFQQAFIGRLQALSSAESLVFEDRVDAVDPVAISREIMAPHVVDRPASVAIEGRAAPLTARKGRMLGLALHELATNAAKYGALSAPDGRILIRWAVREDEHATRLNLLWRESDGPEVSPPQRKGFGTRLLEDVVSHELHGEASLSHHRTGVEYRLSFPP